MPGKSQVPPTFDDFVEAQKVSLEWRLRRKYAPDSNREADRLFTNAEAAEELDVSESKWFELRSSLKLEPVARRGRSPLFDRSQVDAAHQKHYRSN